MRKAARGVALTGVVLWIVFGCPTFQSRTEAKRLGRVFPGSSVPSRHSNVWFGRFTNRQDYELYGGPGGGPRPPLAPETKEPLPSRRIVVPIFFPVLGDNGIVHWHDSYNVNRGSYRHTAVDIQAPKMRPIVAPFPGIVGFKTQTFWIFGDNHYKCLGTHLNDDTPGTNDNRADPDFMFAPNLRPGDHVVGGQLIGYVGNSGNATGPHLHFEMFAPDGVLFDPFPSLQAATHRSAPRPVLAYPGVRPAPGEIRLDGCFRKWDAERGILTLLLVTRQTTDGHAVAYATPTWYRLTVPPQLLDSLGGDETLRALPRDRPVIVTVSAPLPGKPKPRPEGTSAYAHRLILPTRS